MHQHPGGARRQIGVHANGRGRAGHLLDGGRDHPDLRRVAGAGHHEWPLQPHRQAESIRVLEVQAARASRVRLHGPRGLAVIPGPELGHLAHPRPPGDRVRPPQAGAQCHAARRLLAAPHLDPDRVGLTGECRDAVDQRSLGRHAEREALHTDAQAMALTAHGDTHPHAAVARLRCVHRHRRVPERVGRDVRRVVAPRAHLQDLVRDGLAVRIGHAQHCGGRGSRGHRLAGRIEHDQGLWQLRAPHEDTRAGQHRVVRSALALQP